MYCLPNDNYLIVQGSSEKKHPSLILVYIEDE